MTDPGPARAPVTSISALGEVVLCSGYPTQLLIGFILAVLGMSALEDGGGLSLRWVITLSVLDTGVLLGLVFYLVHRAGESPRALLLGTRPVGREVRLGLTLVPGVLALVILGMAGLHLVWPELRNVPQNPLEGLLATPQGTVSFIVVAVLAGAVREEVQRAFILRRFEQHLGGAWVGVVVFSLAFGLGHRIQGWDAVVVTGALGAVWGGIYLWRRSVVASMVSHAGFNVTEILAVVAGVAAGAG